MATLPDTPQVIKFAVYGTTQGQPYVNTFHARYSGSRPDGNGLNSIASSGNAAYWNAFGPVLNANTGSVQTTAIDLTDRNALIGVSTVAFAGAKTGPIVPSVQIACCISWKIASRYRGGHPRMYLPAADSADIVNGRQWEATVLAAYETAADTFMTNVNQMSAASLSFQFVAVRYQGVGTSTGTGTPYPVVDTVVHGRVDSMRRRLGKETA